jgi:3-oxoacyl-[acyl-carrier protein] reductase
MPKIFWITGAASGLGHALASSALRSGHAVFATDIDQPTLEAAATASGWPRDRAVVSPLVVRDPAGWRRAETAFETRFERLDVMINNAGVLVTGPLHAATDDDIDRTVDVNVKGVMFGSRHAANLMLRARPGGGHIVNIASLSALAPVPGIGVYSATKFAVRGYTLALAFELKPKGIAVTCVCPDGIATPMLAPHAQSEDAALIFSGPRILRVEEVCAAILGTVLETRPLEIIVPRSRGWLAKMGGMAPEMAARTVGVLRWRGRKQQEKLRS